MSSLWKTYCPTKLSSETLLSCSSAIDSAQVLSSVLTERSSIFSSLLLDYRGEVGPEPRPQPFLQPHPAWCHLKILAVFVLQLKHWVVWCKSWTVPFNASLYFERKSVITAFRKGLLISSALALDKFHLVHFSFYKKTEACEKMT